MGSLKLVLFYYPAALLAIATITLGLNDIYFEHSCSTVQGNYTADSTYQTNLNTIISQLSSPTQFNYGFYNLSTGVAPDDQVYATGLCRGDQNQDDCNKCLNYTAKELRQFCPSNKGATAWSEFCLVRYSKENMYGQLENEPRTCVYNEHNASNPDQFNAALTELLTQLRQKVAAAPASWLRKYEADNATVGEKQKIYAMVQCSPDMNQEDCSFCLNFAMSEITNCCPGRIGCRVLRPTCILRYETDYPFYGTPVPLPTSPTASPQSSPGGTSNRTIRTILVVIASVVGALILIILSVCFVFRKRKILERVETEEDDMMEISSLQFDLASVLEATNNFSDQNKLGQGGFGAVYKGQLPNGNEIAVKRLFSYSTQGELEFKNEVVLVAKLQHRNLVKLLGFCLEKQERLLIFEFVPNSSLDRFIFDPNKRVGLKWESRFHIIEGIARGLLYLHRDSRVQIIHRDLKAGNILLDSDMMPKIADFGTARLFEHDQGQHVTDRIMGTYGYMAPEYVVNGQFSEKSDVFSFGVIIFEIISGQRCTDYYIRNEEYFLSFVWRNWREGTPFNLIDSCLSDGSRNEMMRCIHTGLLCVQEDVTGRPSMASVVTMLSSMTSALTLPSKPAFLMETHIECENSSSNHSNAELIPVSINEASITDLSAR